MGDFMYIENKLKALGFETITPIQEGVFKAIHSKKHLVGLSPTGTGKTHAYLLPILANLDVSRSEVQAVITVPTNELVIQVSQMLKDVDQDVVLRTYYGGSNKQKEQQWLEKNQPQVVIATPNRIYEYAVELNILKLQHTKYFVLDEADMMFDYDFLSMIDTLLPTMPKAKYLLFSATIEQQMEGFIKKYFGTYDLINTHQDLKIEYQLINIKYQDRLDSLSKVVDQINPYTCFVFVSKKENQELVYQKLLEKGLDVINLNASIGVKKRMKIIDDIKAMKYSYVVTSDLAARGLDFKISHVIHYDLPYHLEFFKHRSGRTGRMHDTGVVITFMSVDDHRKIEKLKKQGIKFVEYLLTSDGLHKKATKTNKLSDEEKEAIKKIKKPTKVTPNYKKKNAKKVKKTKQEIRRKAYAKNR